ncbi:DUF1501 domain-containing protein [Urbifossiella limnaea]|uniref:DUF1501 domain-containing protein n=1 Tax=Urbifossiella limnaea TaxID=2528023 RepID=A0A517XNU4_9BACT|nr:DUF1501 domain-containing protein [Urbifossiella limnaea]QDU19180.1 hypothetical protein ETAA1_10840 [Urbifossiella limnaea]
MISLTNPAVRSADRVARREWLRVGGLGAVGLSLPHLLAAQPAPTPAPPLASELGSTFGRAKNCIFLWLQGGPPQHETFDPKPDAPVDIRGPFRPVATSVPGVRFSELLPRTAAQAHRLAVIRSLSTRDDNHDVSGYWLLTGYPYGPGSARQIKPSDWPYFGSVLRMLKPSERLPALTSVWLPDLMRLNDNVTPAGQTAGFLGKVWEPARFVGDPAAADYHIDGLTLQADLAARAAGRRDLLAGFDRGFDLRGRNEPVEAWDRLSHHALDLVTSGAARAAFDLGKEPASLRDRYGRHTWGQSCLLARRLVEAGVRLVHVNWPRDPGDSAVDNPLWDTHAQNADRLQDSLCPMFDVSFAALLDDLAERGLLGETLVVVVGEFGRTPRINAQGGRDHWGHVFSMALAGAGVRGGSVVGASDKNGAYPTTDPVRGGDLTATIFHLLGVDPGGMFHDRTTRPHPITKGEPVASALGSSAPARQAAGGDPAFVPPYDPAPILDPTFAARGPLIAASPPTRDKGWRADPTAGPLLVRKEAGGVFLGCAGEVPAGTRAVLAQEIRNARGGRYTFTVRAAGGAATAEEYERGFLAHTTCRLVLFRFRDAKKDVRAVDELAAAEFRPAFGAAGEFRVERFLASAAPGANFPIGNGLGVAVVLTVNRALTARAGVRVATAEVAFSPAPRFDNDDR